LHPRQILLAYLVFFILVVLFVLMRFFVFPPPNTPKKSSIVEEQAAVTVNPRQPEEQPYVPHIKLVAGCCPMKFGNSGDGGPAVLAQIGGPQGDVSGMCFDSAGNLYTADWNSNGNGDVRKIDQHGIISTLFGCVGMLGISRDSAGNFYTGESKGLRKINPQGVITTIAGGEKMGFWGDGGPATLALISYADNPLIDPKDNIYFSDVQNNRVRKIDTSGIITTIAGNGTAGYSGDGGKATDAELNDPQQLGMGPNGDLFVVDFKNSRIRKIDKDGIISTVAGNGVQGYSGDGGEAVLAELNQPLGVAINSKGELFICEKEDGFIRKVDLKGFISTVAGAPQGKYWGSTGNGGPARLAKIEPKDIALDPSDNLYINEGMQIREVDFGTEKNFIPVPKDAWVNFGGSNIPIYESFFDYRKVNIFVDRNIPYVICDGFATKSNPLGRPNYTLVTFNGKKWTTVGNPEIKVSDKKWPALFVKNGKPLVAYRDVDSKKAVVMEYLNYHWKRVGKKGFF
jgi:hypothetical protein